MGDSGVQDYGTTVQIPTDQDTTAPTSMGDGNVDFDDLLRYLLGVRNDLASKLATGDFDMGTHKVKSSAVPTAGADLVNKTYADGIIAAADAMVFKGVIDCSASPNYPAADRGWTYRVSVAGKIGGASGINVEVGDLLLCLTDGTASGTQAAVGAQWEIAQANIDGAVTGPSSSTDNAVALFNGTSGKVVKDSGVILGSLASKSTVASADITDGTIVNADISASADIAASKLHVADLLPWLTSIDPLAAAAVSQTNFDSPFVDVAQLYNGYLMSSGAQNAEVNFDVILAAGTWDIRLLVAQASNAGIYTVQLDGVTVGTADGYSAATQRNQRLAVNGVTVATTGKKRLKLLMATKNASSANYYAYLSAIQLQRTA